MHLDFKGFSSMESLKEEFQGFPKPTWKVLSLLQGAAWRTISFWFFPVMESRFYFIT